MADAIFIKVVYITERFDLTDPQSGAFKFIINLNMDLGEEVVQLESEQFIFQLYNFLSEAKADNDSFHEPQRQLAGAKDWVDWQCYPAISTKEKHKVSHNDSTRSCAPSAPGGV